MCGEYENARKAFAKLSGEFLFIVFCTVSFKCVFEFLKSLTAFKVRECVEEMLMLAAEFRGEEPQLIFCLFELESEFGFPFITAFIVLGGKLFKLESDLFGSLGKLIKFSHTLFQVDHRNESCN